MAIYVEIKGEGPYKLSFKIENGRTKPNYQDHRGYLDLLFLDAVIALGKFSINPEVQSEIVLRDKKGQVILSTRDDVELLGMIARANENNVDINIIQEGTDVKRWQRRNT